MQLKKKKRTLNLKHKIVLFLVYFVLFATLSAMVDYYAYDLINPWIFIVLSFLGAVWATLVHVNSRQKSRADEIAKEIEEIL